MDLARFKEIVAREEDLIRGNLATCLSYREALLRLVAPQSWFQSVRKPEVRAQYFTLALASPVTACEHGLRVSQGFGSESALRRKLNEAEAS